MSKLVSLNISESIKSYRAGRKWYRRFCKRSAVALIIREENNTHEVLMIKRAEREGDPWSGQMGFPGGMSDRVDKNNLQTARRETLEEIGLDTDQYTTYLSRLSDIHARPRKFFKPMVITPYIFTIEQVPELTLNHEVAEVVWVPLPFIADHSNRERMDFERGNLKVNLPCYHFQGRTIWGLSLMMLDELMGIIQ